MGFCRRCGDIVVGERCKCGGRPVEPIVAFRNSADLESQDRWSKTYASGKPSRSPTRSSTSSVHRNPGTGATGAFSRSTTSKPFPRPISTSASSSSNKHATNVGSRVTDYITSTTSRPRSPLKPHVTGPNPEAGILPSLTPNDNTLSKVYGSVLQPKETLATFSCAICSTVFPPDATIYPDPQQPSSSHRFLCRPCFVDNGGSKGPCGTCSRPVLTLKTEGGFIHAADKYWHKRCFNCAGCAKNIGDSPMVDLLGQPCCPDCFDDCLKRDSTPKKKQRPTIDPTKTEPVPIPATLNKSQSKSHEASPVIGELEERLGVKRREGSPAMEELSHRLGLIGKDMNSRPSAGSPSTSPTLNRSRNGRVGTRSDADMLSRSTSSSPTKSPQMHRSKSSGSPVPENVEEMRQRLFKSITAGSPRSGLFASSSRDKAMSSSRSSSALSDGSSSPSIPPIPDLISDFSDTMTQSSLSGYDSPPNGSADDVFSASKSGGKDWNARFSRSEYYSPLDEAIIEETNSQLSTPVKTPTRTPNKSANDKLTPSKSSSAAAASSPLRQSTSSSSAKQQLDPTRAATTCSRCEGKLFTMAAGGSFITVSDAEGNPSRYHVECFTCQVCDGVFEKGSNGQATFVRHGGRACHPECAPKERIVVHKSPSSPGLRARAATVAAARPSPSPTPLTKPVISSRFEQSAVVTHQPLNDTVPVPRFGGPRNACPGCKKAVSPMEKGVIPGPHGTKWHSSCLVCGGKKTRPVSWYAGRDAAEKSKPGCGKKLDSAAKSDGDGGVWCRECILQLGIQSTSPQPSPTKTALSPTYTGLGKMVPQFTGTTTLVRQFTGMGGSIGEGLARQGTGSGLNPNRSISPTKQSGLRPRPKSVIGMRSSKSIDEGRGMFLVRQMTGTSSAGWNDS